MIYGTGVTVRRGMLTDLSALLTLVGTFSEAPRWPEQAWRKFLDTEGHTTQERLLLLAEEPQGQLSGVLAATCLQMDTELEWVLVHPGRRRQGIGRALLHTWLTWAETAHPTKALLEVRASNLPAVRLYESLGFVMAGRRKAYYHDPVEDALLMTRRFGLS